MMKKKKFKKFKLKINFKTIQPLILLTLIFTMLGLSFGKLLDNFLVPTQGPTATVGGPNDQPQELEKSKDVEAEEGQSDASESTTAENEIYVMQLGVYETYDNVLSLAGELKQLGYNYGILKVDGILNIQFWTSVSPRFYWVCGFHGKCFESSSPVSCSCLKPRNIVKSMLLGFLLRVKISVPFRYSREA